MTNVAAIVPAYNEETTISEVVRVLRASPLIQEVIVISDGSTDQTASRAHAAGATLVHSLPRKSGKGQAMLHGVAHTTAPIVLFLDADLLGLTQEHLERLLRPVLSGVRSMNCGLRDRGIIVNFIQSRLPLIGGERALRRTIFESVPPRFLSGFMVEIALNYACKARKLVYGAVLLPGLRIRHKYEKVGWIEALVQYARMFAQVGFAVIRVRVARLLGRF